LASKPVLVANKNPLPEIVQDNVDGYVIDPNNENLWAEKIIELIKNPELSREIGSNGKEKAFKSYSIEKMITGIEKMYASVMK